MRRRAIGKVCSRSAPEDWLRLQGKAIPSRVGRLTFDELIKLTEAAASRKLLLRYFRERAGLN